jgi:hypothetical protein
MAFGLSRTFETRLWFDSAGSLDWISDDFWMRSGVFHGFQLAAKSLRENCTHFGVICLP